VVVVKPCGYPVERTLAELELLPQVLPWASWPAVQAGQVFVADGTAYFTALAPGSSTLPSSWPPACTLGGSPAI